MTRLAGELLEDLDKDTVDFEPNYDDSTMEPSFRECNLLVNGSGGIAVGMATNIPPHNLREVIDATVALINEPSLTIDDLMEHVQGPDFPTAGFIHGRGNCRRVSYGAWNCSNAGKESISRPTRMEKRRLSSRNCPTRSTRRSC